MLQRGRDHVCAVLSFYEVPAWRPTEPQQWPICPLKGTTHSVSRLCHKIEIQHRKSVDFLPLMTDSNLICASSGSCGSCAVRCVGRDRLPEGERAPKPQKGRLHPGRTPCACEVTFRPDSSESELTCIQIYQHILYTLGGSVLAAFIYFLHNSCMLWWLAAYTGPYKLSIWYDQRIICHQFVAGLKMIQRYTFSSIPFKNISQYYIRCQ